MTKTNALRLLEQGGIEFEPHEYPVDDGKIDAVSVAAKIGVSAEQCFKTLVTQSSDNDYYVFVIPGSSELDLKKAARAAGCKSIEMIPSKKLLPLTGYVHGGCSPVGMKKVLSTFIDEIAVIYDFIAVSGGKVGLNITVHPEKLSEFIDAEFVDLVK